MAEEQREGQDMFSDFSEMDDRPGLIQRVRDMLQSFFRKILSGGPMALVFLFLIGGAFGMAAKTLAREKITIGYWDYTVSSQDIAAVNVNALEKEVSERAKQTAADAAQQIEDSNTPPVPPPPTEPPSSMEGTEGAN